MSLPSRSGDCLGLSLAASAIRDAPSADRTDLAGGFRLKAVLQTIAKSGPCAVRQDHLISISNCREPRMTVSAKLSN